MTNTKWVVGTVLPLSQKHWKQWSRQKHAGIRRVMATPTLSVKLRIDRFTRSIKRISLRLTQAWSTHEKIGTTNFGPITDMVQTILSGMELPQTYQAMGKRNISTKG